LQQQVQQAQAAKAQADSEREAAAKRADAVARTLARTRNELRAAQAERDALKTEREALTTRVATLEKQAETDKRNADAALAGKDREIDYLSRFVETTDKQWQVRFDSQSNTLGECSAKNEKLLAVGRELIARYRAKGFADVARQKEPLLGLGEVRLFEQAQDWRDRVDAERFKPPVARTP
jgi:predicted RNase H-like nuclease (RuvC/YqgF family)